MAAYFYNKYFMTGAVKGGAPMHLTGTSNESWLPLTSSKASSGRSVAFMKLLRMPLYICVDSPCGDEVVAAVSQQRQMW